MKISQKYENIKKNPLNKDIFEKKKKREQILENIITLMDEDDKLRKLTQYLIHLQKIKLDRIENSFNNKFVNITKNLILNDNIIDPKK
jgi:hypothetical protein